MRELKSFTVLLQKTSILLLFFLFVHASYAETVNYVIKKFGADEKTLEYSITYALDPDLSEHTAIVKQFDSNILSDVVIPSTIEYAGVEYTVVAIGERAFYRATINSISFASTITELKQDAFYECNIQSNSIVIPGTIKNIGGGCFYSSTVQEVILEEGIEYLNNTVFGHCEQLTNIVFPSSITFLGANLCANCTALTDVTLPNSDFTWGEDPYHSSNLFSDCTSLKNVVVPDKITKIGVNCFNKCISLSSVTLSKRLEVIEIWAFRDCM